MVRHQYEDEQQHELVGWNVATAAATASATTETPFAATAATAATTTTEYAG